MVRNNPIGFTLPCHSKLVRRCNFTRGGYVITLSKFSLIDEDRWSFARRQLRIKHRLGSLEPRLARVWCHFAANEPHLRDRCLKWSFRRWRTAEKKQTLVRFHARGGEERWPVVVHPIEISRWRYSFFERAAVIKFRSSERNGNFRRRVFRKIRQIRWSDVYRRCLTKEDTICIGRVAP